MPNNFLVILFIISTCLPLNSLFSQDIEKYNSLDQKFKDYEIFEVDANKVYQQISELRSDGIIELNLTDEITWRLSLENSHIISDEYLVVEATESGLVKKRGTKILPMQGYIIGQTNSRVSLTFNDNFIYGFIKSGFSTYFIEPLYHYEKTANKNKFVLYSAQDIIPDETKICGYELYEQEMNKTKKNTIERTGQRMPGGCLRVHYAIASDWSMFDHYGNQGTQNHNVGVLNNVQTNYDDEFADEIQFAISEQWLSTCSTCDPWPNTTNSGTVLNSFTSWAVNGFSTAHNLGSLWSRRSYNNGVIGLAWVGVLCTQNRYNILSDFSNNAQLKRVLMAHEIGHNFDASHNSGIMAPSVNTSNTWTTTSINEIEAHYNQAWCLDDCPGSNPITVDFSYDQTEFCGEAEVSFEGISNSATTWSWTFDNGNPATSSEQNPVVSYDTPGTYEVTLNVSNGSNSANTSMFIDVEITPFPISDYQYIVNGLQVNFIYTGLGADNYFWDFDDGDISSAQNPIHLFTSNGTYNVTLEVTNDCGSNSFTFPIEINAPPFVNFISNVQSGCQPLEVGFTSLASNVDSIKWTFNGGSPQISSVENPVITYNQPGIYQVILEGFNSTGSIILSRDSFITVQPLPVAGFSWTLSDNILNVTNAAVEFDSIYWSFGDGANSSEINPIHNYWDNGTFVVTQNLLNSCGLVTLSDTLTIALPPLSQFEFDDDQKCVNDTLQFLEMVSFSPDSLLWLFEGGTPQMSNESNPSVIYTSPGYFDVTLISWNAYGTDTLVMDSVIHILDLPSVSFNYLTDTLFVSFTSNINNGNNLMWNFGDGNSSTQANPTHNYQNYGNYLVTLSADNQCGARSIQQEIIVQALPTANFSVVNNPICNGSQVQFINNSSASATSYQWSFEGGIPSTSTERNPLITYPEPGSYSVSLTVTNNSGSNEAILDDYIIVDSIPYSAFDYSLDNLIFNGQFTGTPGSSVEWNFGDGSVSTDLNPQYSYQSYGSYQITLISSNQCGVDTLNQMVQVYILPSANFNSSVTAVCVGDSIQFFNNSTGPFTEIQWDFEGGEPSFSNIENPMVYYRNKGVFDVQLTVSNPLGSNQLILEDHVEIEGLPIASFSSTINGLEFSGNFNGEDAERIEWNFGDGNTSTEENPSHQYMSEGQYIVTLYAYNSCGIDSLSREFNITMSSSDNLLNTEKFLLLPNPTNTYVDIIIENVSEKSLHISITNTLGQLIEDFEFHAQNNKVFTVDLSRYKKGLYLVTLQSEGQSGTKPLIILD